MKSLLYLKKRTDIKAACSVDIGYILTLSDTVGTYKSVLLCIPYKKMVVIKVELIYISTLVGSFTNFPESYFPQSSNFM